MRGELLGRGSYLGFQSLRVLAKARRAVRR